MRKVCVIQVLGRLRLGRESYKKVTFRIKNEKYHSILSGEAMCKYYNEKKECECKLYILAPESLITSKITGWRKISSFFKLFGKNMGKFTEVIKIVKEYEENVKKCFINELPVMNIENVYLKIIPSIGYYKALEYSIIYEGLKFNDIDLYLFLTLLDIINEYNEIIVDVSTGHNIYTTALIRALRNIIVAYKFSILDRYLLGQKYDDKNFFIAVAPPIGDPKATYIISEHKTSVPIFLRYPLDEERINTINIARILGVQGVLIKSDDILKDIANSFKFLKSYLKYGLKLHNAIKYNTPLVLYFHTEILNGQEYSVNEVNKFINELRELILASLLRFKINVIEGNRQIRILRTHNIDRDLVLDTLLSIKITQSLLRFADTIKYDMVYSKGVPLSKLRERFIPKKQGIKGIYDKFPELYLNEILLTRDLDEIEDVAQKLGEGKYIVLSRPFTLDESEETNNRGKEEEWSKPKRGDIRRNFFAHSGLLRQIVGIYKEKGEIYLKYDMNRKRTDINIDKWLLEAGT